MLLFIKYLSGSCIYLTISIRVVLFTWLSVISHPGLAIVCINVLSFKILIQIAVVKNKTIQPMPEVIDISKSDDLA